jgi:hypothetical protein
LNEIQDGRFPNRRLQLLARGRSSSQGENSSSNNRPDTNAGQSEWTENALHLSLRRGGFGDQMIRILSAKKCAHQLRRWFFRERKTASCHFAFDSVNVNFLRASVLACD